MDVKQKMMPFLWFDTEALEAAEFYVSLFKDSKISSVSRYKDKYGLSWQIIPDALGELLSDPDPEKAGRVMQAMLQMRKLGGPRAIGTLT